MEKESAHRPIGTRYIDVLAALEKVKNRHLLS